MHTLAQENGFMVRHASPEDAVGGHGLSRQLAAAIGDSPPEREAVGERLAELISEPRARVLAAEDESGVKGVATLWIKPDLAHGDTVVEVPTIVVDESSRGLGVGKLLMRAVRDLAAEQGASLIELVATRDNASARAFYKSLGFVETAHISLEYFGD